MGNTTLFQPMKIHLNHSFVGVQGSFGNSGAFFTLQPGAGLCMVLRAPIPCPLIAPKKPSRGKRSHKQGRKKQLRGYRVDGILRIAVVASATKSRSLDSQAQQPSLMRMLSHTTLTLFSIRKRLGSLVLG